MRRCLLACLAWLILACLPQALPAAAPAAMASLPSITVRTLPGTEPSLMHDLEHVRPPKGGEPVILQIDLANKRVLNGAGRVVAGPDSTRMDYLQSVVDKWRYAAALSALARAHPLEVTSEWGDDGSPQAAPRPWVADTGATFIVPHVPAGQWLLFFGMGPRGDIYYLGADDFGGDGAIISARAVPPYGAETLVAVTSTDAAGIRALGTWLAETARSRGVIDTQGEVLRQIEALRDLRIGVLASYTCRTAPECVK
jgi:hypothetical protein